MALLPPFAIEQWMDTYETTCTHNLAETCSDSLSLSALSTLNPQHPFPSFSPTKKLDYGHIRGSPQFRRNVSGFYNPPVDADSGVLITSGAIGANLLVLYGLVKAGDHVVCMHPTYQQLYDVPKSLGAEVELWKLREVGGEYKLDVEELKRMVRPPKKEEEEEEEEEEGGGSGTGRTRLIIINNPNNPTGYSIPHSVLTALISLASSYSIPILSDEVYRPLFHSFPSPPPLPPPPPPPSILDLYPSHGIATSSLSKAYALAGIRVGWVASHNATLMTKLASVRHYGTISVSQLDDAVASFALSPEVLPALLDRNITLCETNLKVLEGWVERVGARWVKPSAATTALVRFRKGGGKEEEGEEEEEEEGEEVDDAWMCKELIKEVGVLVAPAGLCFGEEWKGCVRIGYACDTEVLKKGLEAWRSWLVRNGLVGGGEVRYGKM